MAKQQKETGVAAQPLGSDHALLKSSAGQDLRAHPPRRGSERILEKGGSRSAGPFSADSVAAERGKVLDHRARPHGEEDGLSFLPDRAVQPLGLGDFTSQKSGDVDRLALPDHPRLKE